MKISRLRDEHARLLQVAMEDELPPYRRVKEEAIDGAKDKYGPVQMLLLLLLEAAVCLLSGSFPRP
jgi:hypothetical protein